VPEVKQAAAMLRLAERGAASSSSQADDLESLAAACAADPKSVAAAEAYAVALFFGNREGDAVDLGLKVLRKSPRSEEARKLVLTMVEALGPRHPRAASARRSFNNVLFI